MGHSVSPCHRHDNQSSLARPHQQNSTHARRVTPYVTLQSHIKDVLCLMMFWPKKCWNIFLQQILFFIWFGLNAWAPCNLYQGLSMKSQISIQNVGNTRGCLKNFCRPCSYNVWRHICHLLKKACFKYFTFLEKNVHMSLVFQVLHCCTFLTLPEKEYSMFFCNTDLMQYVIITSHSLS